MRSDLWYDYLHESESEQYIIPQVHSSIYIHILPDTNSHCKISNTKTKHHFSSQKTKLLTSQKQNNFHKRKAKLLTCWKYQLERKKHAWHWHLIKGPDMGPYIKGQNVDSAALYNRKPQCLVVLRAWQNSAITFAYGYSSMGNRLLC